MVQVHLGAPILQVVDNFFKKSKLLTKSEGRARSSIVRPRWSIDALPPLGTSVPPRLLGWLQAPSQTARETRALRTRRALFFYN